MIRITPATPFTISMSPVRIPLTITAEALVESQPSSICPRRSMPANGLASIRPPRPASSGTCSVRVPSRRTDLLDLLHVTSVSAGGRSLGTVRQLATEIYDRFEYSPSATRVDSPIDEALETRRGVCQDFAHIMIALVRQLGVPCRYVSGYLSHPVDSAIRSPDGATHAWVEAWFPSLGWVGVDPTNNLVAGERHIRVAVGRDYSDVPPTRGVFKGSSAVRSELAVSVRVGSVDGSAGSDSVPFVPWMSLEAASPLPDLETSQQQQQ
jgi:hypothetical protein